MAIATTVLVTSPVDPYDLFGAARTVVGSPPLWHEHDFTDLRMLQTEGGQGAAAQVSVHFPPGGGSFQEEDGPAWHALLTFTNSGWGASGTAQERLVQALAVWLDGNGLHWAWRFEDRPWKTDRAGDDGGDVPPRED